MVNLQIISNSFLIKNALTQLSWSLSVLKPVFYFIDNNTSYSHL